MRAIATAGASSEERATPPRRKPHATRFCHSLLVGHWWGIRDSHRRWVMPKSELSPRVAVYTGTFDPVHLGHLDVIRRGSRLFDRMVIGVGVNPDKQPFFSTEERV